MPPPSITSAVFLASIMMPHTTLDPMKRIFRQLLADEEGTFDVETGQQPRTGFAYAPTATALLKADEPTPDAIRTALARARREGARYLSTWRHPGGPLVFFATSVTQDESLAREHVAATGQRTYFDLERGRTVTVRAY